MLHFATVATFSSITATYSIFANNSTNSIYAARASFTKNSFIAGFSINSSIYSTNSITASCSTIVSETH